MESNSHPQFALLLRIFTEKEQADVGTSRQATRKGMALLYPHVEAAHRAVSRLVGPSPCGWPCSRLYNLCLLLISPTHTLHQDQLIAAFPTGTGVFTGAQLFLIHGVLPDGIDAVVLVERCRTSQTL